MASKPQIKTIKEFDKITCNPAFNKPDSPFCYVTKSQFSELENFIAEYADTNNEDANVLDLMSITKKKNVGDVITFKNYVGLIELKSGLQIEILPKISYLSSSSKEEEIRKTKTIFKNMLRAMKEFEGKSFNFANLEVDKMNIYDIFVNMYLQEVASLVKKGLKSNYIKIEENLNIVKGKILMKENLQRNIANLSKIYCVFDEYQTNRVENRLIKSTLLKFSNMNISYNNLKLSRQLLSFFENVDPSINYDADFKGIHLDRNMKDYDLLMRWSKVFLLNKSFTSFSGKTASRVLLFQMDKLFEQFVAKFVKQNARAKMWYASAQTTGLYLFDSPRKFSLRPDLLIKKSDGKLVIMDTKWKTLHDKPNDNYGISQADMYQMYAYAKKYESQNYDVPPDVWVLYPLTDEMRKYVDQNNQISFSGYDGVTVRIYFIDLENYKNSIANLLQII